MPVLNMFGVPLRHCINGITKSDKVNIDSIPSLDERITELNERIVELDEKITKLENIKLVEMVETQYASYIEQIVDPYGEISYGFKNDILLIDHVNTCKIYIKAHTPFERCEPIITRMNYYSDGMDTHNYSYNLNNLSPSNKSVRFTDSHLYTKPTDISNSVWSTTTINKTLWTDLSVYVYKEV